MQDYITYEKIDERKFLAVIDEDYFLIVTYPFRVYHIGASNEFDKDDVIVLIKEHAVAEIDIEAYIRKINSYFCLELVPSNRCNLACTGCIAKSDAGLYSLDNCNDMSEDMIVFCIIKAIAAMENRLINNLVDDDDISLNFFITGGEPFMNGDNLLNGLLEGKRLFEEMARKYGKRATYDPQIVTNGLLIRENQVQKIKELNALITISFDTPLNPNKVDKYGASHREEAVEKFHMLVNAGHKRVSANLCVAAQYVSRLDEMMDYLSARGIIGQASSIQMSPMSPPIHSSESLNNDNKEISSYKQDLNASRFFSEKLIEYSLKYNTDMKLYRRRMLAQIMNGGILHRCCILNNKWCIMPSGDIYVCHMLGGIEDFHMGSIFNQNWAETEKYAELSRKFYDRLTISVEPCTDCILQTVCINFIDCPARNLLENGDMDYVGAHQCETAKSYLLYLLKDIIKKEFTPND